jgi:hypothetical protein
MGPLGQLPRVMDQKIENFGNFPEVSEVVFLLRSRTFDLSRPRLTTRFVARTKFPWGQRRYRSRQLFNHRGPPALRGLGFANFPGSREVPMRKFRGEGQPYGKAGILDQSRFGDFADGCKRGRAAIVVRPPRHDRFPKANSRSLVASATGHLATRNFAVAN